MLASSTVCYKYLYISFCIYSFECRSALKNFRVFLCGTWWPFIWEWLSLKNNNLQIITKILIKHIRKNFLGLLIKHIKVSNALWLFLLAFFYKVSWLYMAEGKCFLTPPSPRNKDLIFVSYPLFFDSNSWHPSPRYTQLTFFQWRSRVLFSACVKQRRHKVL